MLLDLRWHSTQLLPRLLPALRVEKKNFPGRSPSAAHFTLARLYHPCALYSSSFLSSAFTSRNEVHHVGSVFRLSCAPHNGIGFNPVKPVHRRCAGFISHGSATFRCTSRH